MNLYGEPVGITSGGTIDGDLDINGDSTISGNLTVDGTLTTDILISRESVETKDALLHLGLDNVADTANLGVFWEYNDGGKLYGGIARDAVNKKIRVFEDQAVKPTPSADISTFALGDLQCDVLESKQITVGTQPVEYALPTVRGTAGQVIKATGVAGTVWADQYDQSLNTADSVEFNAITADTSIKLKTSSPADEILLFAVPDKLSILDLLNGTPTTLAEFSPLGLSVGNSPNNYTLPPTRGTLGQSLITDNSGQVSWQSPSAAPIIGDALVQLDQPASYTNKVDRFNRSIVPDALNATYALSAGAGVLTQKPVYAEHLDIWIAHSNSGGVGSIVYSADTINWSVAVLPNLPTQGMVSYSKEKKLCVWFGLLNPGSLVSQSTDGITWSAPSTIAQTCSISEPPVYIARYSRWYIPCNVSANALIVSADWITFTTITISRKIFDIAYNERIIVAVGDSGSSYSLDGTTFINSVSSLGFHGLSYNNDLDIFHYVSSNNLYWHSKDGINWTSATNASLGLPNSIINHYYIPELQVTIASTSTALYYAQGHPSPNNLFRGPIATPGTSGLYLAEEAFYYDKMRGVFGINTTAGYHVGTLSEGLIIGNTIADTYKLPTTRGTLGQVLKTDGAGDVSWQAQFDQDLNTADTPSFAGLALDSAGNATIFLRHSNSLKWTIQNSQSQGDILAIRDAGTIERMSIAQAGNVRIGNTIANTHYSLPTVRGTLGQVLKTDGAGNVSWQAQFDQSLNTTDAVQFAECASDAIRYQSPLGVVSVQPGGLEQHLDFSYSGGAGFAPLLTLDGLGSTFPMPLSVQGALEVSGALTMGIPPTSYVLPNTRGSADQILRTDGSGNVSWQFQPNIFDQTLNTTDTPTFSGLSIVGAGNAQISTNASAGLNSSFISFQKGAVQYASAGVDLQNQFAVYNQSGEICHSPVGTQNMVFSGAVTSTGTLTASNDWVHNQCAIEVYTDVNLSPTACVLAYTPYQVIFGSTTISFAHMFTAITNPPNSFRITYTGTRARRFMLSCTLSFQTNTDTVNIDFFLYRNGVAIPGTKVSMHHPKAGPAPQSTQIQSLPQLAPGDFIDVYASSNTPNVDVIVTSADIQCFCLSNLV